MLPNQFSSRMGGTRVSFGLLLLALAGALLLAIVGWIVVGMATPPDAVPVSVDVPVKV